MERKRKRKAGKKKEERRKGGLQEVKLSTLTNQFINLRNCNIIWVLTWIKPHKLSFTKDMCFYLNFQGNTQASPSPSMVILSRASNELLRTSRALFLLFAISSIVRISWPSHPYLCAISSVSFSASTSPSLSSSSESSESDSSFLREDSSFFRWMTFYPIII